MKINTILGFILLMLSVLLSDAKSGREVLEEFKEHTSGETGAHVSPPKVWRRKREAVNSKFVGGGKCLVSPTKYIPRFLS